MAFHVGQLVVAIQDWPDSEAEGLNVPVKGNVYTVRSVEESFIEPGLLLDEVVNDPEYCLEGFLEPIWFIDGFRPVTKRNEEIVASLLQPVPETENA